MANNATINSITTAALAAFSDVTTGATVSITYGASGSATIAFALPTTGNGSLFNSALPTLCAVLNNSGVIDGSQNSGLAATLGIQSVTSSATYGLIVTVVNSSTNATATIAAGTRFLFFQAQGV